MILVGIAYNTLVVAAGVAAVGFAAGVVGALCVLRKRALVGDAAARMSREWLQDRAEHARDPSGIPPAMFPDGEPHP